MIWCAYRGALPRLIVAFVVQENSPTSRSMLSGASMTSVMPSKHPNPELPDFSLMVEPDKISITHFKWMAHAIDITPSPPSPNRM